jgi:hypothetical protein
MACAAASSGTVSPSATRSVTVELNRSTSTTTTMSDAASPAAHSPVVLLGCLRNAAAVAREVLAEQTRRAARTSVATVERHGMRRGIQRHRLALSNPVGHRGAEPQHIDHDDGLRGRAAPPPTLER